MEKAPDITDILFLDIETVSCHDKYQLMSDRLKIMWDKKAVLIHKEEDEDPEEFFFKKAGIYAEFGKIVTIAVGYLFKSDDVVSLKIKAFTSDDEKQLLLDFKELLENGFKSHNLFLCAHNGKEFDFPYICRRMIYNGIPLPKVLDIGSKKPWEVKHLDTLEMWKFGDRKNYTSLELLATLFDIETSKDGIDGSMVNHIYYVEKDLQKIETYCKADVVVLANLYLKLKCHTVVSKDRIFII
ncbi:MAG: 3'-5' exonuclease [Bacteroidota bacterium]|nr:3'-5' exonuclease [Bacteroidota bacterium]